MNCQHPTLAIAGTLSLLAAALHVAIIFGGAAWYRLFGAGESMARAAERGSASPAITTSVITVLLTLCGLYALSGAGAIGRLPLVRPALVLITTVYLGRGLLGFFALRLTDNAYIHELSFRFWFVSSLVITTVGAIHAVGIYDAWTDLGS